MTRPNLTKTISVEDFREFYWLKEELKDFCREHDLSTGGSKIEIADRIVHYLETGEVKQPLSKSKQASGKKTPLTLESLIRKNYRSDEEHRAFFKVCIGEHFKFTTAFMNFCKQYAGVKTYADAVDFWLKEQEQQRDPNYQPEIAPQFEYNRFIRAYFANNPDKSLREAIEAWKEVRAKPGSHEYKPE